MCNKTECNCGCRPDTNVLTMNGDIEWLRRALKGVGSVQVHYELDTRWKERGRLLAWGYIGEKKTIEAARKMRDRLISDHTDGPIVSGYEVRIRRVTVSTIYEEVPNNPPNRTCGCSGSGEACVCQGELQLSIPQDSAWQPNERLDS